MSVEATRFKQGNDAAVVHGAHAVIAPVELRAVADAIRPSLPVRHRADEQALYELADVEVRLLRVRRYVDANDPWEPSISRAESKRRLAATRSALRHEDRYAGRKMRILKELGMTPRERAKLGFDIARTASLTEAMSEPDPYRRAELLRDLGVKPDA